MVELSGVNSSGIWAGLLVVASHLCLFSFPDIDSAVICNRIDQNRHYFQKDYKTKWKISVFTSCTKFLEVIQN